MENISKNAKGRPPKHDKNYQAEIGTIFETSGRALNNRIWFMAAFPLKDDKKCAWLFETDSRGDYKRSTLIGEIGRLSDIDKNTMREFAYKISEMKPTVRLGIIKLRAARKAMQGKQQPTRGPAAFENEIIKTIDDYWARYPNTTAADIRQVLYKISERLG
jgi:hypothetical protein